jgi:prevent-host-death family protein
MFSLKKTPADTVATVTELRSKTSVLIDLAKKTGAVLIQKNNEPESVLVSAAEYERLIKNQK